MKAMMAPNRTAKTPTPSTVSRKQPCSPWQRGSCFAARTINIPTDSPSAAPKRRMARMSAPWRPIPTSTPPATIWARVRDSDWRAGSMNRLGTNQTQAPASIPPSSHTRRQLSARLLRRLGWLLFRATYQESTSQIGLSFQSVGAVVRQEKAGRKYQEESTPCRIRTCDLVLRRHPLWSTELRGRGTADYK